MLELYFVFYRIPKMMSRLARERNRSALKWSLLGIAAWIGAELFVAVGLGILYGAGMIFWGWPEKEPASFTLLSYVAALAAAIGGYALVHRILSNLPNQQGFSQPPPPPRF